MRNFQDYHLEKLSDINEARRHLKVALEEYEKDGDATAFLLALKDLAQAKGGFSYLAEKTNLNRQNLYKALSKRGNPRLNTVEAILRCFGFRLSIEPLT
ncbi:MAG: addiction module antidote protein [Patescibacteria group bacterium]